MKKPKAKSRENHWGKSKVNSDGAKVSSALLPTQPVQTSLVEAKIPVLHTANIPRNAQNPSAEEEIRALRAASNLAIATGDLLALSSTLTHSFIVIIGDGTQLSRAAYLEAFASIFKQAVPVRYERTADAIHISSPLPIAAEHGHWAGTLPDGSVACTGTYMAMWRQVNSRWQLRSELFVTLA